MKKNYLEKVYSGLVGKTMGVILGAPVEPTLWTYDRIYRTYGDITGYVKSFKNFAADDDLNGPIFFLKALDLMKEGETFSAEHVGKAWLNYAREGIGMFWWGGYGTSTEHTAFLNLKNGIMPPMSGSEAVNGLAIAEQIGGQIFIDTWGLIWPSNMEKAADYAEKAASVSHDKNGIYGARFVAACIAKAFDSNDIRQVVTSALSVIPEACEYRRVCNAVMTFYDQDQDHDFRKCLDFLHREFGYDRYPGVCHIIPNSGVMMLAMLYGEGKLDRTIEIATMCGWDTDCNAGNVGTILGVMNGYEGLSKRYLPQINDVIVASSSVGSLNIIDLPTQAKEVAAYGYALQGESDSMPETIVQAVSDKKRLYFDFEIEGSTHGMRTRDAVRFPIRHMAGCGQNGSGALGVLLDRVYRGQAGHVYYKPYYRREDFDDERYQPAFSPKVFSGQVLRTTVFLDKWNGDDFVITPYVKTSHTKTCMLGKPVFIDAEKWIELCFEIPDTQGEPIEEVGIKLESMTRERNKTLGNLYMDTFVIEGKGHHKIDVSKEKREFMTTTQFTENGGSFTVEDGWIHVITNEEAIALTGNFYNKDVIYRARLMPEYGENHYLAFKMQGLKIGYFVGLEPGKAVLKQLDFGAQTLVEVPFEWHHHKDYMLEVRVLGTTITLWIDGVQILEYTADQILEHGCVGYAVVRGRLKVKDISFEEY